MKLEFLFGIMLTMTSFAVAQDWAKKRLDASPRHMEWVDVKHGNRTVKTFVAYPERKDKAPVVIVIHEIFGATDWALGVADQLAEHGYIALVPDMLSGMAPNGGRTSDFAETQKAREAVSGLPKEQVTADLNAVADYAMKIPASNKKLFVSGFCWGGTQSFRFATERPDLAGAFVFYGTGPDDPAAIAKIKSPVFGFYGGNDERINATLDNQKKLMADAKKSYTVTIYDGAGHGFMRAGEDPAGLPDNKKARDEGWKMWLKILSDPALCCD
jgi:carboxymethylenebutenolidase